MAKVSPQLPHEEKRDETAPEFHRRVQDAMDADSWQGVDRIGCDFPEPAEVVEIEPFSEHVIYKRKDGV
ncbi:MAG TPA: hypothetical protein VNH84_07510 [Candidatus Saccharimonadales bacterium]|nr:hypothetical protein [Candidatus Saccharimonadales bacterium]